MDEVKTGMDAVRSVTSLASLARDIGVTRGAVAQWERVPAERIAEVSRSTGLPFDILRPDLFTAPAEAKEAAE